MGEIVKPELLHLQVYQILKKSIMDGERKPSERIVESQIAKQLGISRAPVREAIRLLVHDGLLEHKGNFIVVYEPSVQDIIEIFQCRQSLEALAVQLAIEYGTEETFIKLKNNMEETERYLNNGMQLKQLDQQFHTIITNASGNNHLIQLLETIKTKIHYMRNSMVKTTFYPTLIDEHEKILLYMEQKDVVRATETMKQHVQKGLDGILQQLKN